MMTKGLRDGKLKKIPKGYKKVGDKIVTDKEYEKSSNKQSKKMSTKKKIAIGAAVTAGALAAYGAYKLSKANTKNRGKFTKDQLKKMGIKTFDFDTFNYETSKVKNRVYTPTPTLKSLGFGKGDGLEDHIKYFKNEEDMRKEISNFMGERNREKALNNLKNIKNKASENVKILRKRR